MTFLRAVGQAPAGLRGRIHTGRRGVEAGTCRTRLHRRGVDLARIRRVIKEATGAEYTSPSGVWRLLKRHRWSRQIPTRRAYERDEKAV
ncbi:winged helix-turn-helix domain-containing protein, partial [Streptomyces sp. VTCC 41912]|uniref:helix-turn-helix domain-containing protein n=1 Tax=Streptomyces sp. VTCC 41912 TaxID=3383243 RepID=UPI0038968458